MQRVFESIATGRGRGKVLLALIAATWVVYGYMLAVSLPAVAAHADGMELFDMRPTGYDATYARELVERLGAEGRHLYLTRQIPVDMVYPLLFAVSYAFLLVYLLWRAFPARRSVCWLAVVPILAGFFDYAENLGIIAMLTSYPEFSPRLATVTGAFTLTKSLLTTLFFTILLVALVVLAARCVARTRRRGHEPAAM